MPKAHIEGAHHAHQARYNRMTDVSPLPDEPKPMDDFPVVTWLPDQLPTKGESDVS